MIPGPPVAPTLPRAAPGRMSTRAHTVPPPIFITLKWRSYTVIAAAGQPSPRSQIHRLFVRELTDRHSLVENAALRAARVGGAHSRRPLVVVQSALGLFWGALIRSSACGRKLPTSSNLFYGGTNLFILQRISISQANSRPQRMMSSRLRLTIRPAMCTSV